MRYKTIYSVFFDGDKAFNCIGEVAHFRSKDRARDFALHNTAHGQYPAKVEEEQVPAHIAQRWNYND